MNRSARLIKYPLLLECLRPWKIFTLLAGVALLVIGSIYDAAPDWDIPISLIMAVLAYLTAPWSMRTILDRRWSQIPLALFYTWLTVDGCYALYWHFKDPIALEQMRSANFPASLSLYGLCGVIWLYNGNLKQLCTEIRNAIKTSTPTRHE